MAAVWSSIEKRKLIYGLYQYGPTNLDALHNILPTKTKLEIKVFCEEQAKIALLKQDDKSKSPSVKLWLQVLKRIKLIHPGLIHGLVPRVLKYIALFEKRASTKPTDLRECYLSLADMCRGLDPQNLDEDGEYFLFECVTNLAKCLKYGECRLYRKHISSLATLKHLHLHRKNPDSKVERSFTLNPLGIPKEFLEMSSIELLKHL